MELPTQHSVMEYTSESIPDLTAFGKMDEVPTYYDDDTYLELRQNIKTEGVRVPIKVAQDSEGQRFIVDGRHRYQAVKDLIEAGEPPLPSLPVQFLGTMTDYQMSRFQQSMLIHRQIDKVQRAQIYLNLFPEQSELIKGRGVGVTAKTADAKVPTHKQIADETGTSVGTVKAGLKVHRDAPDLSKKVASGEMTLNQASQATNATNKHLQELGYDPDVDAEAAELRKNLLAEATEKAAEKGVDVAKATRELIAQRQVDEAVGKEVERDGEWYRTYHEAMSMMVEVLEEDGFGEGSLDCIIADLPYSPTIVEDGTLDDFKSLVYTLKPGGDLFVLWGELNMPQKLAKFYKAYKDAAGQEDVDEPLTFIAGIYIDQRTGSKATNTLQPHLLKMDTKQILWFRKRDIDEEGRYVTNLPKGLAQNASNTLVFGVEPEDDRRDFHFWGQNVGVFAELIKRFTKPGAVILDPVCGSGTTGMAVRRAGQGRYFIGSDVAEEWVDKTCQALKIAEQETAKVEQEKNLHALEYTADN